MRDHACDGSWCGASGGRRKSSLPDVASPAGRHFRSLELVGNENRQIERMRIIEKLHKTKTPFDDFSRLNW